MIQEVKLRKTKENKHAKCEIGVSILQEFILQKTAENAF